MKNRYQKISIFLFAFFFTLTLSAQTYVKQDATGANDGTSWNDAYTSFSDALTNTSTGEIWVANGTYKPGGMTPDSSSTFKIASAVSVYGGFAGTETNVADRDLTTNVTILSGDINDDDDATDLSLNKGDNIQHVMFVDSLLGSPITIDGFSFIGGNTSDFDGQDEFFWRGGGIFTYNTVHIKNCKFSENFGRSGAGVYISPFGGGGGNGSTFENCEFSNNITSAQSAGIYLEALDDITITNCTFSNNQSNRGVLYPNSCTNIAVNNCMFNDNAHIFTNGFGGVLFNWQSTGYTFTDCEFMNNVGGNGGVMYHDGRFAPMDANNLVFTNCNFEGNIATDFGGAVMYTWMSSYTFDNCTFNNNTGPNGSHIFNTGSENKEVLIKDCTFDGGMSTFGGAMTCYGTNSTYTFENTLFEDSEAATSGGALIIGFSAVANINNCEFTLNEASFGGAISVQNDSTIVNITNTIFNENAASSNGGAINFGGAGDYSVDQSTFTSNVANVGGAITVGEFSDTTKEGSFMLTNTLLDFNVAETQAAGLNIFNSASTIYNNQFSNNTNLNDGTANGGAGGAISINVGDTTTRVMTLINNTIVNNIAPIGAGIATFTSDPGLESFLTVNLQNNIIYNPDGGNDYEIEAGIPEAVSLGGNINEDATMLTILTDATDQPGESEVGFVDSDDDDFRLLPTSIAVNNGVVTGAPTTDILGVMRDDMPDIGAYEYDFANSVKETIVENNGTLKILPNPVNELLTLELTNEWNGDLVVRIFNVMGQEVTNFEINKNENVLLKSTSVTHLTTGVYDVIISNGSEAVVERFLKL